MKTLPEYRTDDEIEIIVRGMQGRDPWTITVPNQDQKFVDLSPDLVSGSHIQALDEFTYYQPEVQRKMARYLFYEEYEANRIIFKEGNLADFMYFVVKGACKFSVVGFKHDSKKTKNRFNKNLLYLAMKITLVFFVFWTINI